MKIVFKIISIIIRGVLFAIIYCLSVIVSEVFTIYQLIKLILHPSKNQFNPQKTPLKAKNA
ncbi:hypothetical protein MYP_2426 [Sporocytophaga myxococcoides]|uniref:Uncharacterized protein n=1 Tax=Sporocytophaga myxococcoides TaxID=153721 RepID=A0A098LFD0_9BACT|nr:hypothetical protein MYP_2426 [Sporocytophaga myxococcoides]